MSNINVHIYRLLYIENSKYSPMSFDKKHREIKEVCKLDVKTTSNKQNEYI